MPENWTEPLDATKEGPGFPEFQFLSQRYSGEEDAGFINVYSVGLSTKKPVLVFIHGGGFFSGSSTTNFYAPDYFMQKELVLVTFNCRIGALGFLSLDDEELGIPGNAGLKDQTVALKWIKRNIENFGGDADNITLFGESSGGASVHYHLISEQSKNLFHKAIVMSGAAFNKSYALLPRRKQAQRLATALGFVNQNATDKELLAFLETADVKELVKAQENVKTEAEEYEESYMTAFGPCIEPYHKLNCFIPKDPVHMAREAWGNKLNVMIGATSNEALGFVTLLPAKPKLLTPMENFVYAVPVELGLDVKSEKCIELGEQLNKLYYKDTEPSKDNLDGYIDVKLDHQNKINIE